MKKREKSVNKIIKGFEKVEENKLKKTFIFAILFCLAVIIAVIYIQIYSQNRIVSKCSYLDPITIDFLAFFAALFLVIEGFARILEHPSASLKRQLTRILRISLGFSILTLHIIQFFHK